MEGTAPRWLSASRSGKRKVLTTSATPAINRTKNARRHRAQRDANPKVILANLTSTRRGESSLPRRFGDRPRAGRTLLRSRTLTDSLHFRGDHRAKSSCGRSSTNCARPRSAPNPWKVIDCAGNLDDSCAASADQLIRDEARSETPIAFEFTKTPGATTRHLFEICAPHRWTAMHQRTTGGRNLNLRLYQ